MDKIRVSAKGNAKIEELMKANEAEIKSEVMADDIRFDEVSGYEKEWKINAETVTLAVEKLS